MKNLTNALLSMAILLSSPNCDDSRNASTTKTLPPQTTRYAEELNCPKDTRPYYHFNSGNEDLTLNYDGKKILLTHSLKEGEPVRVGGYIVGEYKQRIGENTLRTCVRPVTNPKQKKGIEDIIRKNGLKGPIKFWKPLKK